MSSNGVKYTGTPSFEELRGTPGFPDEQELYAGPVAIIECVEEIPCNPCEAACPRHSIVVGDDITSLPVLDARSCTGCGNCITCCPGLAIYVKDYTYEADRASITFPFEYLPLPRKGDMVDMVDRYGQILCPGEILLVREHKRNVQTALVTAAFDKACFLEVISMKRLER